jgi:alkylated DNA repair dioxygenase AlkB
MSWREQFKQNGFVVLPKMLKKQTCKLLKTQFKMMEACKYYTEQADIKNGDVFQDTQVPHSFPWYGATCFESLLLMFQEDFEEILDKKLHPCYTYARIMHKGADMKIHKDRESCQFSATICISEDKKNPYPIFMEDYSGKSHEVHLAPGDLILYNGTELNHWREEYKGKEQIQAFIHYVDANGPYSNFRFDKRPMLGLPSGFKS